MFEKLISTDDCLAGCGVFVRHGERELAVFHLLASNQFIVSDNACPHSEGNLSAGELNGCKVTCPMHDWTFDLELGRCVGTDDVLLTRYACETRGDALFVDLSTALPIAPPQKHDFL